MGSRSQDDPRSLADTMIQLILCFVCCGNFDFAFEAKIAALTPPVQNTAPVIQNTAPVTRYAAPVIRYAAPVTRYAGPTWTWPGDLANHLRVEHGQNVSGMSFESMRALHDNLHNGTRYTMPSYTMPSYCPSGT